MKLSKLYKELILFFLYKIFKILHGKDFRVDCLIIGSPKAGTSAIIEMLSQHKQIIVPKKISKTNFINKICI